MSSETENAGEEMAMNSEVVQTQDNQESEAVVQSASR